MSPSRSQQPSLTLGTTTSPSSTTPDLPPVSALFLIDFDVKAGYTITWKQATEGIDLDGAVEYKSLPSGLHDVKEDLVYFVHEGTHAGLSAFVNLPTDEEEARHARMIAVGVLVPLSYGRLGRAWRHADGLKRLASTLAEDREQTAVLQKYWDANKPQGADKSSNTIARPQAEEAPVSSAGIAFPSLAVPQQPSQKGKGHSRKRSASDGAALTAPENKLTPYHPAWSLTSLLDTFGPLIFPIHRAALLRQRILISCHAPVHEVCDFVYNISVLSNIPLSVMDVLPQGAPTKRLRPLFTIGVHDMPFLMDDASASKQRRDPEEALVEEEDEQEKGTGWIACTTDSILAMKDTLWDMLITMPPDHAANARERVWPTVELPGKRVVKATQRDLRRYNALRAGLHRLAATTSPSESGPSSSDDGEARSNGGSTWSSPEKVAEPPTWAALAYNGFMWWASAGEQLRSEEQEERQQDASLLATFDGSSPSASMSMPRPVSRENLLNTPLASLTSGRRTGEGAAKIELAIIAYFHRLTTQMIAELGNVVDNAGPSYSDEPEGDDQDDDEDGVDRDGAPLLRAGSDQLIEEDEGPTVCVDSRAVESMGLDIWSEGDAVFISELSRRYFGQSASIEGRHVEMCGVRVC